MEAALSSNAYILSMTEEELTATVIELAMFHHWHVVHFRPTRTMKGWRTLLQGHVGSPDLILARGGVVLLVELKSQRGILGKEQADWALAIGDQYRLWRPSDLDTIKKELARR